MGVRIRPSNNLDMEDQIFQNNILFIKTFKLFAR